MSEIILGWDVGDDAPRFGFSQRPGPSAAEARLVVDPSESHLLAIAPTGKGKSRSLAIPNLLHWRGPAVVLDLKGELTATTARYRRETLGQQVVVLDPWGITEEKSASFNPLDTMAGTEDLGDEAYRMASLVAPPHSSREPFWGERAEALVAGLIAAVVSLKDGEPTLGRVNDLLTAEDALYDFAKLLDMRKDMADFARRQIAGFVGLVDNTRCGVLSSATSQMRLFAGERIRRSTERSSFDLEAVTRGDPLTLYLVVPPAALLSHAPVIRLWFAALMSLVTKRRVRPPLSTLFVLDEMAQIGPMPHIQAAVTLSRSYGMRCLLMVQSYSQLRRLYPEDHQALLENCGSIVTFGHTSRTMSVELSGMLGDVSADALRALQGSQAAVRTGDQDTHILRRLDYLSDEMFLGRADPNPFFGESASR